MRYVAGAIYGAVVFVNTADGFGAVASGVFVALGTIAALFAVEGIVKDAVRRHGR